MDSYEIFNFYCHMFNFFRRKNSFVHSKNQWTKDELNKIKWEKLQRRTLRWSVIRQYTIATELKDSKHLSEFKNLLNDWYFVKDTINHVNDFNLNDHDFDVIRRFIRIEQEYGRCKYEIVPDITMDNYSNLQELNLEQFLLSVYNNFESYWEDVLKSYKRLSSKVNRLKSLITSLTDDINNPITDYPLVRNKISTLINKYDQELQLLS